jgi:hypothetical protein
MTTQASGINAKLPPVSYSKAIDIWTGSCMTFIFGALLEFAVVTYMASKDFVKSRQYLIYKIRFFIENRKQSLAEPQPAPITGSNSFPISTGNPRLVSTPLISSSVADPYGVCVNFIQLFALI